MVNRRTFIAAAAVTALLTAAAAVAPAAAAPFTAEALAAAKQSGAPVLVEITAPWCPTCKAQKPILAGLTGQPDFSRFVVLEVDFDHQKDVVRSLGARMQSTLIVFKGAHETGRSVGDTDPASIEALLRSAL